MLDLAWQKLVYANKIQFCYCNTRGYAILSLNWLMENHIQTVQSLQSISPYLFLLFCEILFYWAKVELHVSLEGISSCLSFMK